MAKNMDTAVTIAIVPRERFSHSVATIESILSNTPESCEYIIIDGNSPSVIKKKIKRLAEDNGIKYIRTDHYLTPNQARNIAIKQCQTEYILFADNDILVKPGWLSAMLECARETNAALVGPLYLEGAFEKQRIHMAGGQAEIIEKDGKRIVQTTHNHAKKILPDLDITLRREETQLIEFHCVLARREIFDKLGLLDESLKSLEEHVDLCLSVRAAGMKVYFEPKSVITYNIEAPLKNYDREYFNLRWSDEWNAASAQKLHEKWQTSSDDPRIIRAVKFGATHRSYGKPPGFKRTVKSYLKKIIS